MAFQLLPFLSLFLIAVPFLLMLLKKSFQLSQHPSGVIPGPRPLPIIGNLHNLFGQQPHHALCRLASVYGPLMRLRFGQVDFIVASAPEEAQEMMKNQDLNFSDRPKLLATEHVFYGWSDISLSPHGEYWRQLRKITATHLLSAMRVKSFALERQDEIRKLVDNITAQRSVNLSSLLPSLTSSITARCVFGNDCEHTERFISVLKAVVALLFRFSLADMFPSLKYVSTITGIEFRARRIRRQLDKIFDQILQDHMRKRHATTGEVKEDLVDVLLRVNDSGTLGLPLTTDNIKAVILDMFGGGTETSAIVVEWAMTELMKNPRCMERVQVELREALNGKSSISENDVEGLHYLKLVIKETMRLHPPAPMILRQSIEACDVLGYKIDAGTRVIINVLALGRDTRYWNDPEKFNPERFDGSSIDFKGASFEFIPFGGGRRICPGLTFGMASVNLILAHLLLCFDWELPKGMKHEDLDMTEKFGFTVYRKSALCLVATPYAPSTV